MSTPTNMTRVRQPRDVEYRRSLPLPSDNRPAIDSAYLTRQRSEQDKPHWHASTEHQTAPSPEELWECGYVVAGVKDGRMVLATFGCALLDERLVESWSTSPMLMITPWDVDGQAFQEHMAKRFDVVRDWSSVLFEPHYGNDEDSASPIESWDLIAAALDRLCRLFFRRASGWTDYIFNNPI